MSININLISGRKKALSALLKAVAEFIAESGNKRISTQLTVNMNPEEKENT